MLKPLPEPTKLLVKWLLESGSFLRGAYKGVMCFKAFTFSSFQLATSEEKKYHTVVPFTGVAILC